MKRQVFVYSIWLLLLTLGCAITPTDPIADPEVVIEATVDTGQAENAADDAVAAAATAEPAGGAGNAAAEADRPDDDAAVAEAAATEESAAPPTATAEPAPSPLLDLPYQTASTGEEIEITLPETETWINQFGGGVSAGSPAVSTWILSTSSQALLDANDLRFSNDVSAAANGTTELNLGPDMLLAIFALDTEHAGAADTPLATLNAIAQAGDLTVYSPPAETTLSGYPAAVATRTGASADGVTMTVVTYVVFSQTQVVVFSIYWPADAADYYAPVVAQILASFTVLR